MKRVMWMIVIAACSKGSESDAPKRDRDGAGRGEDAAPAPLVDKDLTKAGSAFAGWTAKGPDDADVIEDMGGARVVTKKVTGWDLAWRMGADDLKELKANLLKGAASYPDMKLTFTTDTADALVWTTEGHSSKSYEFHIHQKSAGQDVTCYTVTPREREPNAKREQEACSTLTKK